MNPVIVLTTAGADFDVRAIATDLVQRRLVACVNIIDSLHSIYAWEGRVTEDREQLLIMKTTDARVDELRDALFAQHPYEVPEFIVLPVSAMSDGYWRWVLDAVD
jgi:periplasmic divalent cation tolerance protein